MERTEAGKGSEGPSILAVHPGALGDVILFGRLLHQLPGRVTFLGRREKADLLVGLGAAARVLDFDTLPVHEVFGDRAISECPLPGFLGHYDRLISCFAAGNRRAELRLQAMCGAWSAAFLPVCPPEDFSGHLLELWADMLGLADILGRQPSSWQVPAEWQDAARSRLGGQGMSGSSKTVVLAPGAGAEDKCWPIERFAELAERLGAEADVVFVVGPAEVERWGAEVIDRLAGRSSTLSSPPLALLAGLLGACDGFVGNDSGVGHLAAAVGAPMVALFGPTRPEHFRPIGPAVKVLAAESLDAIAVLTVLEALRDMRVGMRQ